MRALPTLCVLLILVGATGCRRNPPPGATLSVEFQGLKGSTYDASDDLDPSTDGLQVALSSVGVDSAGAAISLASAQLTVTSVAQPASTASYSNATLSGNTALFDGVTLFDGQNTLLVTVTALESTARTATASATVTVDFPVVPPVRSVETVGYQHDDNHDAKLNLTEQASGAPVMLLTTAHVTNGATVTVVDAQNSSVVYGTATVTGNAATISLDALPVDATTEATFLFGIHVVDGAEVVDAAASLEVDRVAPTLTVQSPSQAAYGVADDAAPVIGGYQLDYIATTTDDAASVTLLLGPGLPASLAISRPGNQVAYEFDPVDFPDGTTFVFDATVTDGAGNVGHSTVDAYVKTAPPAVTAFDFKNDANHDRVLSAFEQATGVVTAQLSLTHLEQGQTVTVKDAILGTVYGTAVLGSTQPLEVDLVDLPITAGTDATFALTVELVDLAGNQSSPGDPNTTVTLTVARSVPVLGLVYPCVGSAGPCPTTSTLGLADDFDHGTAGFQMGIQVSAPPNVSQVTFTEQAGSVSPGSSVTVPTAAGFASTTYPAPVSTVSARYVVRVTASDDNGNPAAPLDLDFTLPAFFSTAVASGGCPNGCTSADLFAAAQVRFVHPSNSHFFPTLAPDYVADLSPGDATAEVNLSFALLGLAGVSVQLESDGVAFGPVQGPFGDNGPHLVTFTSVALSAGSSAIGVRLFDGAGDLLSKTGSALVDVIPPAQTVSGLTLVTPNTGSVFDARHGSAQLTWTAAGDDGTSGGPVAGYDVRWSTDAVLPPVNTGPTSAPVWTQPGIADDATFFNLNGTLVRSAVGSPFPDGTLSTTLTDVPPLGRYYVVVRGVDAVGNYAPLPSPSAQTLDNQLQLKVVDNGGVSSAYQFGAYLQAGDLDGDGFADLVTQESGVGVPSPVLKAWVAKGSATLTTMTPAVVTLPASTVDATPMSVSDLSVGSLTTARSTPLAPRELVLSGASWGGARGRVVIYLGGAGAPTTAGGAGSPTNLTGTYVEIRGASAGDRLGNAFKIIPDIDADGLDELIVSAPAKNGKGGRVYLFKGRSASAWRALAATQDGSSGEMFIPVTSANAVFDGGPTHPRLISVPPNQLSDSGGPYLKKDPGSSLVTVATLGTPFNGVTVTVTSTDPRFASGSFVVTGTASSFTYDDGLVAGGPSNTNATGTVTISGGVPDSALSTNGAFGRKHGYAVSTDGVVIPECLDMLNNAYVYDRAQVNAAAGATVASSSVIRAAESMSLRPNGSIQGFAQDAVGAQLGGLSDLDLAFGYPLLSQVRVFLDPSAGAPGNPIILQGNGRFGNQLDSTDLDGDGLTDLLISTNNDARGSNYLTGAFLFFGGSGGTPMDTAIQGFRQARLLGDQASLQTAQALGTIGLSATVGDFNGDGAPDVAVSDPNATTGGGQVGKVFIRY